MSLISKYSLDLHSQYDYEYHCSKKSIELFSSAIKHDDLLPSRCSHIYKFVKGTILGPFRITYRVISKIVNIVCKIFGLLCIVLNCNSKQRKERFFFEVVNILLLQPLSIIVTVAAVVMRIVFAFTGMFLPCLAARGYKWAAQITAFPIYLQAALWKKIAPISPHSGRQFCPITPEAALDYLSNAKVAKVVSAMGRASKDIEEDQLEKELNEQFVKYFAYMNKNKKLLELVFNKNDLEQKGSIAELRRSVTSVSNLTNVDITRELRKLRISIFDLYTSLRLRMKNGNGVTPQDFIQIQNELANNTNDFSSNLFRELGENVDEINEFVNGYGSARYPVDTTKIEISVGRPSYHL